MVYSDLDLIQMQVEALFVHDPNGKLLRINEPDVTNAAPLFFLSRTRAGNLWRTRYDLPLDPVTELERLATTEPVAVNLFDSPRYAAEYTELLKQYVPQVTIEEGPAYYLPTLDLSHDAVMITHENITLLQAYFPWLLTTLTDYAPVAAVVADGNAVAVCFCSRITVQVAEAGVYTEASYRGRGFATEAVCGWATVIRSVGRLPLYDTSWLNSASQAIAKKLGAVQYGVNYSVT